MNIWLSTQFARSCENSQRVGGWRALFIRKQFLTRLLLTTGQSKTDYLLANADDLGCNVACEYK